MSESIIRRESNITSQIVVPIRDGVKIAAFTNRKTNAVHEHEAFVNWPAIGACSPQEARAFGLALIMAAGEAERLAELRNEWEIDNINARWTPSKKTRKS